MFADLIESHLSPPRMAAGLARCSPPCRLRYMVNAGLVAVPRARLQVGGAYMVALADKFTTRSKPTPEQGRAQRWRQRNTPAAIDKTPRPGRCFRRHHCVSVAAASAGKVQGLPRSGSLSSTPSWPRCLMAGKAGGGGGLLHRSTTRVANPAQLGLGPTLTTLRAPSSWPLWGADGLPTYTFP